MDEITAREEKSDQEAKSARTRAKAEKAVAKLERAARKAGRAVAGETSHAPRRRILFCMHHPSFLRNFERTILILKERGFDIRVGISRKHKSIQPEDFESVADGRVDARVLKKMALPADFRSKARVWRDVLFYAGDDFRQADSLRERFPQHQKGLISERQYRRVLALFDRMPAWLRRGIDRGLDLVERRSGFHPGAVPVMDKIRPDLLVVTPLVHFLSHEIEFLKIAKARGIPTVLPVASWDNLTNKGVIKIKPDLVAVWNEDMADEAARLHGIPRDRIAITGATVFDWWFDQGEALSRDEFLRQAGFDPRREVPTLVYLCSSVSIANGNEVDIVEAWARRMRASPDARLRDANIIVRPHPMLVTTWQSRFAEQAQSEAAASAPDRSYLLFPDNVAPPNGSEQKAIFYNTIRHADAIIGLNTSAMIEAAILGKPVLSFKGHSAERTQAANLHFQHLARSGAVQVARDLDEHQDQLLAALDAPERTAAAAATFVDRFVRPRGRDQEAATLLADEIEALYERRTG